MIRNREESASPAEASTHVKADLYLAGMRLANTRPPTAAERLLLMLLGY